MGTGRETDKETTTQETKNDMISYKSLCQYIKRFVYIHIREA